MTAVILGFALRLVWVDDMEYKRDEYSRGDYSPRFLGYPLIGEHRTWLVLLMQVVSGATGLTIDLRGVWRRLVEGPWGDLLSELRHG